jgi:hypothetical protein
VADSTSQPFVFLLKVNDWAVGRFFHFRKGINTWKANRRGCSESGESATASIHGLWRLPAPSG